MIELTVLTVKIGLVCLRCGKELTTYQEDKEKPFLVKVDPCQTCLSTQEEVGYDKGYFDATQGINPK